MKSKKCFCEPCKCERGVLEAAGKSLALYKAFRGGGRVGGLGRIWLREAERRLAGAVACRRGRQS